MKQIDKNKLDIVAYIRGDVSADERTAIETLMRQDAEFAADVEFQKTLRATLQSNDSPELGHEFGWARLSKAIDDESQNAQKIVPVASNVRGIPAKLWQYAAVALACVVFGQAYVIGSDRAADANDKYFMAGNVEVQSHLILKPSQTVPVAAMTDFLSQNNAMITMGPDKDGQYEISFETLEACDTALEALQGSDGIFEMTTGCEEK